MTWWNVRDLRGHFALLRDSRAPCPHPCCNGSRPHPRKIPVQLTGRLRRKLDREARADTARLAAAGPRKQRPSSTRARDREDLRLAMHAQDLRAENYAMGYKTETAGFYGSDKVAQAETSERRLSTADADRETRARAAYEREQAASYRTRQAAKPTSAQDEDWYAAWA